MLTLHVIQAQYGDCLILSATRRALLADSSWSSTRCTGSKKAPCYFGLRVTFMPPFP